MNDHDTRTTALLEAATDHLDADVDRLVAGAVARGGRLRRRRTASSLAAVAAIGVIGAAASVIDLPHEAEGTHFTMSPATPTTLPAEAVRRFGMDPAKTAWVLSDLLPPGKVTHRVSGSDQVDSERYRDGRLLFNGGMVSVRGEWVDDRDDEVCAAHSCVDIGLGDRMAVWSSESMSPDGRAVTNSVVVYFADGWSVGAFAANYRSAPDREPIADEPVLTVDQLKAIALNDVWFDEQQ